MLVIGAALAVLLVLALIYLWRGLSSPGDGAASTAYGAPVQGKSLATVHLGRKTAYFPGVICTSTDPEIVIVSLGVQDDRISFFLAAFLGPQSADGSYIAPVTTLVAGHRPGVAFNQEGSGSIAISGDFASELSSSRSSSAITFGRMSFKGMDSSGESLSGQVSCGAPTTSFQCPVTPGVPASKADESFNKVAGIAFGNGPVFAIVNGATADRIPFPTPWPGRIYAQKVPWMSRPSYAGAVSVSGHRLDASGEALFGWGVPPDMTALQWKFPGINGNFQPASAGVRSAGCYEWDVVGEGFREQIVFNATLG